jgi:hypothetical protein
MKTYKYLDADLDLIKSEITSYTVDFSVYKLGFTELPINELLTKSPTLSSWFETMNCKPTYSYMIRTPVGSNKDNAHVDNWVENPVENTSSEYALAINIPIKNTEDTHTEFYEYIDGPVKNMEFGSHNIIYSFYGKANLKEIDRFSLTKPAILNTTVPHSVINNTDKDRFALTFRFKKDPWHLYD